MDWVIRWAAPLTPDLECVPGEDVFVECTQRYSLTANVAGVPDLQFASSDFLLQGRNKAISQTNNQVSSQANYQISKQTKKQTMQKRKRKKSSRKKA
jgi:Cadherin C-terminal cytoplasmic tail, catenin-binding region